MFLFFKNIKSHAKRTRDFLLELVFPTECLSCGHEGAWLCQKCFRALDFKVDSICPACDQPSHYGRYCQNCQPNFFLDGVLIAGDYKNKLIEKLIKNLKYRFIHGIAEIIADYLMFYFRSQLNRVRINTLSDLSLPFWRQFKTMKDAPLILSDWQNVLVIPIPLHKKRLSWRGFNQAEVIARLFAQKFNLEINAQNLIRVKHRPPQAKLNSTQRKENIRNCFAWTGEDLTGKNILLLDDILTTGSTLNEAARILKQKNAQEIWGLVVAKG